MDQIKRHYDIFLLTISNGKASHCRIEMICECHFMLTLIRMVKWKNVAVPNKENTVFYSAYIF